MRNDDFVDFIAIILSDYGNSAYLRKTNAKSFDKVRGTVLWKLWYGSDLTDFCVRTIEYEYRKALRDKSLMPIFVTNLTGLFNSLQEEFNKLLPMEGK